MSAKQPFTLAIANGSAKMRNAPTAAPQANNSNRYEDRLHARATLAQIYAGLLGVDAMKGDLLDAIRRATTSSAKDTVKAAAIARGLEAVGGLTKMETVHHLTPDHWPALAYMTSGQVLLVLGQSRGDLILF